MQNNFLTFTTQSNLLLWTIFHWRSKSRIVSSPQLLVKLTFSSSKKILIISVKLMIGNLFKTKKMFPNNKKSIKISSIGSVNYRNSNSNLRRSFQKSKCSNKKKSQN
jgi:hypothetical protein